MSGVDPVYGRRVAASAAAVAEMAKAGDVPGLICELKSPFETDDVIVRLGALVYLGRLRARSAIPYIVPLLLHDSREEVRAAAARALGRMRDEASALALITALRDPNAGVRVRAAEALAEFDVLPPDATATLLAALEDDSHWVRAAAARALVRSPVQEQTTVRAALAGLASDRSWRVRRASRATLRRLTQMLL